MTPPVRTEQLLLVRDLGVEFRRHRGTPPLKAVDGVGFEIAPQETLGLVGESGSGKSTLGRAILGLVSVTRGSISFDGKDITHADAGERRRLSSQLSVVFQDPYSSLNPTRTVGQTLSETLRVHEKADSAEIKKRVGEMLERVGLPGGAANRYPSSFSGGQRQRIAIARALMVHPRLVICDEPTSALDLSVQAQILNLFKELQEQFRVSYLFISHDLSVVRHISHRIAVLYRGRIMEEGASETLYSKPAHPYTRKLMDAAPVPDPALQRLRRVSRIQAIRPKSAAPAEACPFAPRCPFAESVCWTVRPKVEETPDDSAVACHRWRELPQYSSNLAGSTDRTGEARRGQA